MGSVVFDGKVANNVKIAYVGGGSRGWARGMMSDLAVCKDMNGTVTLYDINYPAAKVNEIVGGKINALPDAVSNFTYVATETIGEALTGADFVIISIMPGTYKEMQSYVHTPEKYGIWQPVGDSTGPGGVIRSLIAVPMFQEIARAIREFCPDAWVINYTNPMTVCTRTLYKEFPEIKAFGCCHEVFGTQKILAALVKDKYGIEVSRNEIRTNVVGVNHFTWVTKATYRNLDLYPLYRDHVEKWKTSHVENIVDDNWMNKAFKDENDNSVKFDLFDRYGVIAAAGDRHLSEFCEASWYLDSPEQVIGKWHFRLTPVSWRVEALEKWRTEQSRKIAAGEMEPQIQCTGEEGVSQMRALLGLGDLVTNVNLPNVGQIPNLPLGAVVESNACFTSGTVVPVQAGEIPPQIYNLVARIAAEQEMLIDAAFKRDLDLAFRAFINDPLVRLPMDEARKLFDELVEESKPYLGEYLNK